MLIKTLKKQFTQFMKEQNSIKNINSLIKYMDKNYNKLSLEDNISALNKFEELETNEINQKIKLYDFLDYIIINQNNLKDTLLMKTMLRLMIANNLYDFSYWKMIQENLIKNNMICNLKEDYLDYLRSFSLAEFSDDSIWNIFEEFFLEKYFIFNLEETKQIAISFAIIKKGSDQFWEKAFELLEEDEDSMEIDFNLNFSIHLLNYLNALNLKNSDKNKISQDLTRINLFVEFINESINYINAFIKDYEYDTKKVIYSSFKDFHRAHFTYKLCETYNIKDDSLQFFIEELEKLFSNYISKNYKKLKENDIEGISKILGYFNSTNSTKIHLFDFNKYEFVMEKDIHGNNKGYLIERSNEKLYEENLKKLKIFRQNLILAFKNNINDFTNAKEILNFFNFFMLNEIEKKDIEELLNNEKILEIIIDEFHLLKIEDILSLAKFMKFYLIEYPRLWIFLQNFVRSYFVNNDYDHIIDINNKKSISNEKIHNFEKDLNLIKEFEDIFDDENLRLEDNVLLQFVYFLRNKKDDLIIKESYIFGSKIDMI
jgi:hypothetical protein